MPNSDDQLRDMTGRMDWLAEVRQQRADGRSAADIARDHGVAPRTVRRWLDGTRGQRREPKAADAFRRHAAARVFSSGTINIKWSADVEYDGRSQGRRGQERGAPFNSMPTVADRLRQGDYAGARDAFNSTLTRQYGASNLRITNFHRLDIDY